MCLPACRPPPACQRCSCLHCRLRSFLSMPAMAHHLPNALPCVHGLDACLLSGLAGCSDAVALLAAPPLRWLCCSVYCRHCGHRPCAPPGCAAPCAPRGLAGAPEGGCSLAHPPCRAAWRFPSHATLCPKPAQLHAPAIHVGAGCLYSPGLAGWLAGFSLACLAACLRSSQLMGCSRMSLTPFCCKARYEP